MQQIREYAGNNPMLIADSEGKGRGSQTTQLPAKCQNVHGPHCCNFEPPKNKPAKHPKANNRKNIDQQRGQRIKRIHMQGRILSTE